MADRGKLTLGIAEIIMSACSLFPFLFIKPRHAVVEARAALPLDGGVKCRQPTWAEDARNRRMPRGETGY